MAKKQLSNDEINKIAVKKSFDDFYAKTGKNPMANQQEAMDHHLSHYSKTVENKPKDNENINLNVSPEEAKPTFTPSQQNFNENDFMKSKIKETDPDLIIDTDIVKLPSDGHFYPFKEVIVEYLTAKDEDILTTPALMENGTVLDEILKRKIKTPGIDVENMLTGDKNAILIFLRASSYGAKYDVEVTNPKTGKPFKASIDLTKIEYKKVETLPDENGEFVVEIPMRKKLVKFKILGDKDLRIIINKAELIQETYNQMFAEISTMRLKGAITEIDGNRSQDYINRFVDAMPAGDALSIRSKMEKVTPGVDLTYEFISPEGHIFKAPIAMGIDFFFPSL